MKEAITALGRLDWDFPQAGTDSGSVHKLHWFPGNFIPQIPAALIEILSSPGDLVLDPFGGSGTTVIEAARLGRRSIYSDKVSACAFLTRRKIAATSRPLDAAVRREIVHALTWDHMCKSQESGYADEGSNPTLTEWFAPDTLAQLRYLWKLIEQQQENDRLILELIFSDLLFACASTGGSHTSTGKIRRHHWGWVADNVRPRELIEHDVIAGFRSRLATLPSFVEARPYCPEILQTDARDLPIVAGSIDLIVTSPPYVAVIDYVRANRLLYLWMNWPFDAERSAEIGARYTRRRRDVVERYLTAMAACWREFERILRPGGRLAIVIGESRAFPGTVDRALRDLDTVLPIIWGPNERRLSRRRVSDRAARESLEVVCVAEKP